MAGPGKSGLGHLGRCLYPGVGRQWRQSQLSDTRLCPPTQIIGASNIVQTMKEMEIYSAPTEWQTARVAYEWAQGFQFRRASLGERLNIPTNTAEDPLDLDEKVLLADRCTIPGFQSVVTHGCTQKTMMMGHRLNVMM